MQQKASPSRPSFSSSVGLGRRAVRRAPCAAPIVPALCNAEVSGAVLHSSLCLTDWFPVDRPTRVAGRAAPVWLRCLVRVVLRYKHGCPCGAGQVSTAPSPASLCISAHDQPIPRRRKFSISKTSLLLLLLLSAIKDEFLNSRDRYTMPRAKRPSKKPTVARRPNKRPTARSRLSCLPAVCAG